MLIHLMPPNKAHAVKAEVPLTTRGVRRMREREARRAEKKNRRARRTTSDGRKGRNES